MAGSLDSKGLLTPLDRSQPTIALHQNPQVEVEFAPPDDVGRVAEGAHHGQTGSLLGIAQLVSNDRHRHTEERRRRRS